MERHIADLPDPLFAPAHGMAPRPHHYPTVEILWRSGLSAAADGVFVMNGDGRISLWNSAAERITGYRAAEVLGRTCWDVFAGRDAQGEQLCSRTCRLLALARSGESVEHFDMQTHTKGRRAIWLNVSTVPVMTSRGCQVVRMFRDVTAVKDVLALIRGRLIGPPAVQDPLGRLTRREAEVLRLMASGATNRMVGARLHISSATVRNHTHHIFTKLGVPNRVAAISHAMSQFMI